MKTTVTFKTPDALDTAVKECATLARELALEESNLSEDEADELYEETKAKAEKILSKFIRSGEYVYVEFDLTAETAKVLKA